MPRRMGPGSDKTAVTFWGSPAYRTLDVGALIGSRSRQRPPAADPARTTSSTSTPFAATWLWADSWAH